MKRNPAREFVYKKLKEDITPGRFPEVDFSPLTTALYNWAGWSLGQAGPLADGQPHPEEGNGFTERPPRPVKGSKTVRAICCCALPGDPIRAFHRPPGARVCRKKLQGQSHLCHHKGYNLRQSAPNSRGLLMITLTLESCRENQTTSHNKASTVPVMRYKLNK